MRDRSHLDVNFSNHKFYIVNKDTKNIVSIGMEDHRLFILVDIRHAKENALATKSASNT